MIITVVSFVAVLVVLVLAHELGHFLTARARGVKVLEFGLGFPPRIYGFKRGDTLYSINAVPLGGFCKMAGEEDPNVADSLASKGHYSRLLVLSAGSIVNLLLPIIFFSLAFMIPHDTIMEPTVISAVIPDSPAARAGIVKGDTLVSANGKPVEQVADWSRYILLNLGQEMDVLVRHSDSSTEVVKLTPRWHPPEGESITGISVDFDLADANQTIVRRSEPFWRAIPMGFWECIDAFVLFKNEVIRWIIGAVSPQVVGPVGMAQITGEVVRSGFSQLLEWAAFMSINLGIVNLLPIPAMDGGRIVFVLVEVIRRGKRLSPQTEGRIHLIGFALLITLMLLVTYRDIINIATSGSAIP